MGDYTHPILGCECVEGHIINDATKQIVFLPPVHNCHYIRARNALMPMAIQIINQRQLALPPEVQHHFPWSYHFSRLMVTLARGSEL